MVGVCSWQQPQVFRFCRISESVAACCIVQPGVLCRLFSSEVMRSRPDGKNLVSTSKVEEDAYFSNEPSFLSKAN